MTTKPHECALALAIPLNRNDFLLGLDLSANKDFIKSLARRNAALTEDALWETVYAHTVTTVTSVAQAASAKGVTVVTNATLSDVRDLFRQFRVVTLVAHWRSARFYPADFLDPNQLIKALVQPPTSLIEKFVNILPQNWISTIQKLEADNDITQTLAKTLANEFNVFLESVKLHPELVPNQTYQTTTYDVDYQKYLNRIAIDGIFRDFILPGNRIEFFDELHPIEDFVTAIPQNYDGLIDFTVCNSVLIGDAIKRQRRCIVIVNKELATLELRMVIYKGIIELLSRLDIDYMNAAAMIRHTSLKWFNYSNMRGKLMKDLKSVLRRYAPTIKMGEEEIPLQKERLKVDLQRLQKSKDWAFYICAGMVILAFLISIGLVVTLFREPDKITILFGATGLTTAGLISVMRGIWKEKVAIELTMALLENIRPEAFESLIPVILQKF
jgi:hypothetical protein